MGRRRSEVTQADVTNVTEGMEEFVEALDECAYDDGRSTKITIKIDGKDSDTITMRIKNPKELSSFIKLSLNK